jgi:hypothetical protein
MTLMPQAVVNYRWKIRRQLAAAGTQRLLIAAAFFPPKTSNPLPHLFIHHLTHSIPIPYQKKTPFQNLCQNHASKSLLIDC